MSQEERLAELERKVEHLHQMFAGGVDVIQNIGGDGRIFQAVIIALMESHPDPEAMAVAVTHHLEKQYASIHFETLPESHVQGAQSAHDFLSSAVKAILAGHKG